MVTPKRVLIIDDEPAVLKLLQRACERAGYKVEATGSAAEFCELVLTKPDFVIIDLLMPGADGVELLRYLADHKVEAAVTLVSGAAPRVVESAARLALAQGLQLLGTLAKPFEIPELLAMLATKPVAHQERHTESAGKVLSADLSVALEQQALTVHFQPQIDLKTNLPVGYEALARWNHPQWGLIYPDRFIAVAEQSGLMPALTDSVASIAFRHFAALEKSGRSLRCSINVSAVSLTDINFPDRLLELMAIENIQPQSVVVEVTESRLFEDSIRTLDVLTRLRLKGIELSIDDFGTGYSTFRQLQLIPFNELKIDKEFVSNCLLNNESESIVRTSIELGARLAIRTVAEGIESFEVAERLRQWGCDVGQGYFYAKPLAPTDFFDWLDGHSGAPEKN